MTNPSASSRLDLKGNAEQTLRFCSQKHGGAKGSSGRRRICHTSAETPREKKRLRQPPLICHFQPFLINPLWSFLMRPDKRPPSSHSFSLIFLPPWSSWQNPPGPWSPAGSAQRQIDISGIDISCSGPCNHFHFTLCCTGEIRHLRRPANQMSFNRTLSLTFTTVYPTNFS